MFVAVLIAFSLQTQSGADLAAEAERLGRYSTLFALCEGYYTTDIAVGRRLSQDFETRAAEAGWDSQDIRDAYGRAQERERSEVGMVLDPSGLGPSEARRVLRQMLIALKPRCERMAEDVPGSITDVAAGNRALDAAVRRLR